jgi:hypothetical protein
MDTTRDDGRPFGDAQLLSGAEGWTDDNSSSPVGPGTDERFVSPRTPGMWLISMLAVTVVYDAVAHASWARSGATLDEAVAGVLELLGTALFLVTIPFFLVWFQRTYRNLPAIGAPGRRFGTGWAIAAWFVPLLNLWRPKQIANEIYRAGTPPPPSSGASSDNVRLVTVWWALFLGSVFAANMMVPVVRCRVVAGPRHLLRGARRRDHRTRGEDHPRPATSCGVTLRRSGRRPQAQSGRAARSGTGDGGAARPCLLDGYEPAHSSRDARVRPPR